jgi:tetratricopeptide (TPR) repeat protein
MTWRHSTTDHDHDHDTALWPVVLLLLAVCGGCAHTATPVAPHTEVPELQVNQLLEVAALAERRGDPLRAQQYVLAARKAGADADKTLPWLLRLYIQDNQYRAAIEAAKEQLRHHPEQSELRMLLAGLYEATDLDVAAVEQYERVLVTRPSDAHAHFAMATLLHENGHEPGRADEHFRAYLALEPQGANAAQARSLLLKELP